MFYLGSFLVAINIHNTLASSKGRHCPYLGRTSNPKHLDYKNVGKKQKVCRQQFPNMALFNRVGKTITVPRKGIWCHLEAY